MRLTPCSRVIVLFLFLSFLIPVCTVYANQSSPPVVAIRVEGNENISTDLILSAVELSLREPFSPPTVQNDINAIYDLGYFSQVYVDTVTYPDGIEVIYVVEEFQIIEEIRIEGNTAIEDETLKANMILARGQVMNWRIFQRDIERIRALYSNEGFLVTAVDEIDFMNGVLNFTIFEGIIEDVVFQGLERTREHVLRRELTFDVPHIFDFSVINRSMRAIYNLGFFDDIAMRIEPGKDRDHVIVKATVVERPTGEAGLGVGYNTDDGWLGFVRYRESNLGGNAQKVELRYEFGARTLYRFTFEEPWLFDTPTFFSLSVYDQVRQRRQYEAREVIGKYEEKRLGGHITLGRDIDEDWRWRLRYKSEFIEILPIEGVVPERGGQTNSLTPTIIYDTRDDPASPSDGWYGSLQAEMAGRFLGGDTDYTKYTLDLRHYIDTGEDTVVALRAMGGIADTELPEYEKFLLGGAQTLRGYDLFEFSGDTMLLFNLEYRWNVTENAQLVLFGDAGYAWELDQTIDFGDIKMGYGVGLRIDTPIGPVSLDYGIGEVGAQTYFSIGHTF